MCNVRSFEFLVLVDLVGTFHSGVSQQYNKSADMVKQGITPFLTKLKLYSDTIYFNFEGMDQARKLKTLSLDNTGLESMQGVSNV